MRVDSDITAIVVTYNSQAHVGACLDAVAASGLRHVVVWDNASSDTGPAVVRARPELGHGTTLHTASENLGFARAVNAAAQGVTTPYLLLVNPDCRPTPEAVEQLLALCEREPDLGAVAPLMRLPDGSRGVAGGSEPSVVKEVVGYLRLDELVPEALKQLVLRVLRRVAPRSVVATYLESREEGGPLDVAWASGFCLLLRRAAFEQVGGFDESYFLYFEDTALGAALRRSGYRCAVLRTARVTHHESASSTPSRKSSHYYASLATYLDRHGSASERRVAAYLARRTAA